VAAPENVFSVLPASRRVDQLVPEVSSTMSDNLVPRVITVIARTQHIPADSISPEQTLEELGIDSLSGLAIVSELEKEFDVEIPNELALALRDIPQMAENLRMLLSIGSESSVALPQG
jgi:acyl carrier protein